MRPSRRAWISSLGLAFAAGLGCSRARPKPAVPARAEGPAVEEKPQAKKYAVRAVKDLPYADDGDKKHRLDLYVPEGLGGYPVLFFVHGGAWKTGDKDFFGVYASFARTYVEQGIGVVVTNYRLSPAVRHPEHAKDVARAVAWTYHNVAKHGGDPERLVLCGHSAGAHLVSLVTADARYLGDLGLTSAVVKGVVPISGPYDVPDGFMQDVFGPKARQASPLRFVRPGLPPFHVFYADQDMIGCDKVPSEAFARALRDKGVTVTTTEVARSNHLDVIARAGTPGGEVSAAIAAFVRRHAK